MAKGMKETATEDCSSTLASREMQDKTVVSYLSHELVGKWECTHIPGGIVNDYHLFKEKLNNMEEN